MITLDQAMQRHALIASAIPVALDDIEAGRNVDIALQLLRATLALTTALVEQHEAERLYRQAAE